MYLSEFFTNQYLRARITRPLTGQWCTHKQFLAAVDKLMKEIAEELGMTVEELETKINASTSIIPNTK